MRIEPNTIRAQHHQRMADKLSQCAGLFSIGEFREAGRTGDRNVFAAETTNADMAAGVAEQGPEPNAG